jgi:hypothetical protein
VRGIWVVGNEWSIDEHVVTNMPINLFLAPHLLYMDDDTLTRILNDQREDFKNIREEFYRIIRFRVGFAIAALAIFSIFVAVGPGDLTISSDELSELLSDFYFLLYLLYTVILLSTVLLYYIRGLVLKPNFLNSVIDCTDRIRKTSDAIRGVYSKKYRSVETGMMQMEENSQRISDMRDDLIRTYGETRVGVAALVGLLLLLVYMIIPDDFLMALLLSFSSFILLVSLRNSKADNIGVFLFPISYSVLVGGLFFLLLLNKPDLFEPVQDVIPLLIILVITLAIPVYNKDRIINKFHQALGFVNRTIGSIRARLR